MKPRHSYEDYEKFMKDLTPQKIANLENVWQPGWEELEGLHPGMSGKLMWHADFFIDIMKKGGLW